MNINIYDFLIYTTDDFLSTISISDLLPITLRSVLKLFSEKSSDSLYDTCNGFKTGLLLRLNISFWLIIKGFNPLLPLSLVSAIGDTGLESKSLLELSYILLFSKLFDSIFVSISFIEDETSLICNSAFLLFIQDSIDTEKSKTFSGKGLYIADDACEKLELSLATDGDFCDLDDDSNILALLDG